MSWWCRSSPKQLRPYTIKFSGQPQDPNPWPTLVAGQVPNTVQGRSHCLQGPDHARTELPDWRHRHVIYVPATEAYTEGPHQPRLHRLLVLSRRTYSLEQSTTTCHLRPFQSNVIQATVKNRALKASIPPLIRDRLRTCDSSHCEWLNVCQQPHNNNNQSHKVAYCDLLTSTFSLRFRVICGSFIH